MNEVIFGSHEIHIKECNVSSGAHEADVIKVLASLEVLKHFNDDQRFFVEDESVREYLKDSNLVTENQDKTLSCDIKQRHECSRVAEVISEFIDDTIKVFHKDHPDGVLNIY